MKPLRIALIAKPGHKDSGVGRYTNQLHAALEALGHTVFIVYPTVPLPAVLVQIVQRLLGWDLTAFFNNYPVWARYPQADIYHITSQNFATLMLLRRPPGKTVITVHDIIPWLVRDDPILRIYDHHLAEWFDRLALAGLRRADGLVVDSTFTQASLRLSDVVVGDAAVVKLGVE